MTDNTKLKTDATELLSDLKKFKSRYNIFYNKKNSGLRKNYV